MDEHEGQGGKRLDARVPDPVVGRPGLALPLEDQSVVDAFFDAVRDGDYAQLLEVLDGEVVMRIDGGHAPGASDVVQGAAAVAARALTFAQLRPYLRRVMVNGGAGAVIAPRGRVFSVMAFTVDDERISRIETLADPDRLRQLDLDSLEG